MKRIGKILLPGVLMVLLIYNLRGGKDILTGLYIVFPLLYIAMGRICADFARELLPCTLLTSIAFLIPINHWFHMGSCIDLALIYSALSIISFLLKTRIRKHRS